MLRVVQCLKFKRIRSMDLRFERQIVINPDRR